MADSALMNYQPSLLQYGASEPLDARQLTIGETYLFFYPFVTTPCLLINLGTPVAAIEQADGKKWQGGVGPDDSIVAYSAICSHKMSHPAKEISFLNYRHDAVTFHSHEEAKSVEKAGVISCCSERSVYDPSQGAKVLGGPAPHPLATIALKYDNITSELYATGSYGADMYDKFFEKFGFRSSMEHKIENPKTLSNDKISVHKLNEYSKQTIKC